MIFSRFLSIIVFLSAFFVSAAGPNFHWSIGAETPPYSDMETHLTADGEGNCYITGRITGTNFIFAGFPVANYSGNSGCVWVAKVDRSGKVKWVKSPSSDGYSEGRAISVDRNGNVFIVGTYAGKNLVFPGYVLPASVEGNTDVFVAKFNSSGVLVWVKKAGGENSDYAGGIAVDYAGNCFITGSFYSKSMIFDQVAVSRYGADASDMFLAKYTPSGDVEWARSFGSGKTVGGSALATDSAGNIYATGMFEGVLSFDSYSINAGPTPARNPFVLKINSSGVTQWVQAGAGTGGGSYGYSIAVNSANQAYITGFFEAPKLNFGNVVLTKTNTTENFYLAKFDSNGNPLWAKSAGNDRYARGTSLGLDSKGSAYVVGYYGGNAINFGSVKLNNSGSSDGFIVKYSENGSVLWGYTLGAGDSDSAWSVAVNEIDQLYVSGAFRSPDVDLGYTHLSLPRAGSSQSTGFFLTRLDDQLPLPRAATVVGEFVNGFIVGITVRDPGFGYTNAPKVMIVGDGSGASATAEVFDGGVRAIHVSNPGKWYTGKTSISVTPPTTGPRRAIAYAQVVNGFVVGVVLVDGGSGYTASPTVFISGGEGRGAKAQSTVENGVVTGFLLDSPGTGYLSVPTVQIATPVSPSVSIRIYSVEVILNVVVNVKYQIEASFDMIAWSPAGDVFVADSAQVSRFFDVNSTGRYYRLIELP